jgi:cell division protein FtsW
MTVLALNVVGLVMVMSASSVTALASYGSSWLFTYRQVAFTLVGLGALFVASRVDYHDLRRLIPPLLVVSGALLFVVLIPGIGTQVAGSRRWIPLGPINLQPSELAKLALVLYTADILVRRAELVDDWREVLRPILLVSGGFALLVMREPDLGTTICLGIIVATLLFAGGVGLRQLVPMGGAALAALTFLALSAPYRRARVFSFLDPFADPERTGYQAVQSLIALGSGGLFGVGLGASRAKWLFLPNAHTDFIFAIIGEELGLVGALLVVALFAVFAFLGVRTAVHAPDRFGYLVAMGVTMWMTGQAIVNIGATIGLLPITGVPLPFVSFGGSALLVNMVAAGILLNIARQGREPARRTR